VARYPAFARSGADGNIFDDTAIAQRDRNNLIVHSGFRLIAEELAPVFPQRDDAHLTTIRQKFVSPISPFAQEEVLVKRKHGFFLTGGSRAAQAEIARRGVNSVPQFAEASRWLRTDSRLIL
jgi:hypothetical protein